MGLTKIFDRFNRQRRFEESIMGILREVLEVSRQQAETTAAMGRALEVLGGLYQTAGPPESWTAESDSAMLEDMLKEYARAQGVSAEEPRRDS